MCIRDSASERIRVGGAVTTIAGGLDANWVIHSVGPIYSKPTNWPEEDALLRGAYVNSIDEALKHNCATVGFSLLSAGIFRGRRSLRKVLQIGCEALSEVVAPPLEEVYLVGFMDNEVEELLQVLAFVGVSSEEKVEAVLAHVHFSDDVVTEVNDVFEDFGIRVGASRADVKAQLLVMCAEQDEAFDDLFLHVKESHSQSDPIIEPFEDGEEEPITRVDGASAEGI
eukprot:TRINITY_DN10659_c0_g1_i5.p1 TRINITY_DN10659_c0_g1~~TRINITY_DN10659_c0_g1_i5.p1  ORF type:complete len:226 (-),score=61.17 TRINITY_DN10659_c0_g1_i5:164-841(-)